MIEDQACGLVVVDCRIDQDWLGSCWKVGVLVPVYNSLHAAHLEVKVVLPYTGRPSALGHSFRHEDFLGGGTATVSTTTRSITVCRELTLETLYCWVGDAVWGTKEPPCGAGWLACDSN